MKLFDGQRSCRGRVRPLSLPLHIMVTAMRVVQSAIALAAVLGLTITLHLYFSQSPKVCLSAP